MSTDLDMSTLESQNVHDLILEQIADSVYFVNRDKRICFWNRSAEKLTGYTADEVIGSKCSDGILCHVDQKGKCLCKDGCPLDATMNDNANRESHVFLHHKNGHRVPVLVRTSPICSHDGTVIGGAEIFNDNTNWMADLDRIQKLKDQVYVDELTGLANRRYVNKTLDIHFAEAKRLDFPFGVIMADIDSFKKFNDSFGHDTGDEVLKMVAQTLQHNCRPYDVAGRWGGEEFLIVTGSTTSTNVHALAERLRALVAESCLAVAGESLSITVSIGATSNRTDDTPESLVARADKLLYQSKAEGGNRVSFHV